VSDAAIKALLLTYPMPLKHMDSLYRRSMSRNKEIAP
jgi:hypothetical protein